jgi:tripartite ATP-independent transporter DctM subunit
MIETAVGFLVFLILTFLEQEIFLSMASGAAAVILAGQMDMDTFQILPQTMLGGVEIQELAAIPLFILAGELMNLGGLTTRLVLFCRVLVGHIQGGLSIVAILVNMLMAGVSGSSVADASATGSVLIPAMKEDGYDVDYAAALIASAATVGPIIPPSIPMIVYAFITNSSIIRLFMGGAVPGIIMGVAMMIVAYLIARRKKYPKLPRASLRDISEATKKASVSLFMPAFILCGVVFGIATVTEVASLAVLYAAVVGSVIYKELRWNNFRKALNSTAVMSAVILITLATASAFSWVMTVLQVGAKLSLLVSATSSNATVVFLVINFFFLIIGCFFEPIPAMMIFVPMLMPLLSSLQIDLVHFGVVIVLNLMIGLLTPPVGMNFYVTATIAKIPAVAVVNKIWPFFFALVVVLILCTIFPSLVLWLPKVLFG